MFRSFITETASKYCDYKLTVNQSLFQIGQLGNFSHRYKWLRSQLFETVAAVM